MEKPTFALGPENRWVTCGGGGGGGKSNRSGGGGVKRWVEQQKQNFRTEKVEDYFFIFFACVFGLFF